MQNISFNILLLIIIIYTFFTNVENLENTGPTDAIKEAVKQVYLADVEAIRNLSAVATKLQTNNGFIAPAHMSIRGKVNINSPTDAKDLPANVALSVENATETSIRLKIKDDAKNITLTNNEGNFSINNVKTGVAFGIMTDGNVAIKQDLTTGSLTTGNLTSSNLTTGNITSTGDFTANTLTTTTHVISNNILAKNNLQVNNKLEVNGMLAVNNINGVNPRDYTPIVITFDGKHNVSYDMGVILTIPHKTLAILTFNNDNAKSKQTMLHNRLDSLGFKSTNSNPFVRYINDYREWRSLTLSVPPGKQVKFFGWTGESKTYGPGYHTITLEFSPHMIWAGWDECAGHFTESLNLNLNKI